MSFIQELSPNDAPALPLWIDGHAYLMMAQDFLLVHGPSGKVLLRVPLYGQEAVDPAVASGQQGQSVWQATSSEAQDTMWRALKDLVDRFGAHLVKLLVEETGADPEAAQQEVAALVAAVAASAEITENRRSEGFSPGANASSVVAVLGDATAPLALPVECILAALCAGRAVVVKPSPKAPSALFATVELFSRAGFPAGLVNCVQGDEAAIAALCNHPGVAALAFAGESTRVETVGLRAQKAGKAFAGGNAREILQKQWGHVLKELG